MKTLWILLCLGAACCVAQTPPADDYQISGIVVDQLTNKPLNHVLVQIVRVSKGGGDASVITSEDGRFAFLHMPKGKYHLSAEKRGEQMEAFHADDNYSTAIVVDGQQKTDGIVFEMRTDASISGSVMGEDGEPVRNAQVHLLRENVLNGEPQTVQAGITMANSAGHFHFSHLASGRYYICAAGIPWNGQALSGQNGEQGLLYPLTFYGDTTDGTAARPIVLPEGNSASVEITLHTVPSIRVKFGQPNRRAALSVPGPGGSTVPVPYASFQGGSEMYLTNISAGRYIVSWSDDSGPGGISETVDLANGSVLTPGQAAGTVVSGKILYSGDKPTGGDTVFLRASRRGGMQAEVAADGTFKFPKVAAGTYEVYQNGQGFLITSVTAQGARMTGDKIQIPSGGTVELLVKAEAAKNLAQVEGFATRDGKGFAGAMVLLLPQEAGRERLIRRDQSDSDGSFTLPNVIPGRYTLVAIDDGRDLAYRSDAVIKPYLNGGVTVTMPASSDAPIKVPVQKRLQ